MKIKSVSVKINKEVVGRLNRASNKAMELTAEAIVSDIVTRGVAPKDTGELERSGFVHKVTDCVFRIMFSTPYARRWYFNLDGATFQKTKNPNAQDHWMDYYLDGEGKAWVVETYIRFFKQEAGGLIK